VGVTAALSTTGAPLVHNRSNPWDKHGGAGTGLANDGYVTFSNIDYNWLSSLYSPAVPYSAFTPFTIGSVNISQAPLPVELKLFRAVAKNKVVEIEWLVDKNELAKNYTIERSRDGVRFEVLKVIDPIKGKETASYNDVDVLPYYGRSFYRLRITDADGRNYFSSVQKVWMGQSGVTIQISPNPAKDRLYVSLASPEKISELSLVNSMGQLMLKETNIQSINKLDISRFSSGMYYLRIIGTNGIMTESFIKQ
jgi:hypothetical protein